jgi:hypothetical protein
VDKQSLPVRVIAAGLPLLVITIVFGAVGYAVTEPEKSVIPPLAAAASQGQAAQGELIATSGNRITIENESGQALEFELPAGVPIEAFTPIDLAALQVGDWLNGGAIPHPDTLLALVRLVLLPEPVTP